MTEQDQFSMAVEIAHRLMDRLRFNRDRSVSIPRKDAEILVAEFLALAATSKRT
jgi:hypothetical protein